MRLLIMFLLLSFVTVDIDKIAKINTLKKQGERAYANGDYEMAVAKFRTLTDSMSIREDPILMNLANSYYHQNDTTNALQFYGQVLASNDKKLKSRAYQQIGVVLQEQNKLQQALNNFKFALKADPANEQARYNYELLKKMLDEQEQQQNDQDDEMEPSEYAKKLKQQADNLAAQNMFGQALQIMQLGLQEDKTVAAYNQFINKLSDVVESQQ